VCAGEVWTEGGFTLALFLIYGRKTVRNGASSGPSVQFFMPRSLLADRLHDT